MSTPRRSLPAILAIFLSTLVTAAGAGASDSAHAAQPDPAAAREYFTDTVLIDQDGRELRLYSDLMQDKTVIISAVFTECEGVCPVTMGNLVKIQKWLGPRLGQDVHLLSLTVDRETDTPERLKEYADKFKVRPGWHFLTGTPENLDFVLRRLGLWVENKEGHSSVFLVGNVPTGLWKKAHGMASADKLIQIVDSVLEDRMETVPGDPAAGRR